ncbi:E3 ubiquitin-protein ligase TRIM71-like [Patella vulgata]|uniref:E3 ubiquitin-protein ligase TRIM71-like n=1 Tax=Patella vulgata TaxID=6465 RepID=UPI00217F4F31|nr:E3 ubiquitin-protein ligase TRIM71-like [Patella vulgata]
MAEYTDREVCSFCLNDYHQPVILDCQHSFCSICLEDYLNRIATNDQFPCPLCRSYTRIPEDGVNGFKLKMTTPTISIPQCDVCTNSVSGFSCKDCQQYLCDSCKTTHDKFKMFKDHSVVRCDDLLLAITESGADKSVNENVKSEYSPHDVCSNHEQKRVKYYCQDCSMVVCSKCFIIDHNGHEYLHLQDESVREEIKGELKTLNVEIKTHIDELEEFSESLNIKYSGVNDSVKTACDKVDEQVNTICREVRRIGDQLKDKMKNTWGGDISDDVHIKYKKLMEDIKRLTEDLKASVKYSVNVLEDSSIVQVLQRLPKVRQEKDESRCRKLDIPDVSYSTFQVAEIDKTLLTNQIGKIVSCNPNIIEDIFNMKDESRGWYRGRCHVVSGFSWRIAVRTGSSFSVVLDLIGVEDKSITSCKADVICKVINKTDDRQSVVKQFAGTVRIHSCLPYWNRGITVKKLLDPTSGFLHDGGLKIQVTFNKITDVRREQLF